jgi:uncharacterized protein (TIGR03083 family)
MDRDETWRVIAQQRRQLADLLDELSDAEWERRSLCAGWRMRDVAAHVALAPQSPSIWAITVDAVRANGRFHRLNHDVAVRHAQRPVTELVDELRRYADSRRLPIVTNYRNILLDTLVHTQDIALPLGRQLPMPPEAAAAAATRVWTMGWPFWARRRLRAVRLVANDVNWSAGTGSEVTGPIDALLLLLTGRTVALSRLTGAGLPRVA